MNNGIYVNTEKISETIEKLKKLKDRLSNVSDSQKELIKTMHNYWSGTTGDKTYTNMTEHNNNYDTYLTTIQNEIDFLNAVIKGYTESDSSTSKKIDENSKF